MLPLFWHHFCFQATIPTVQRIQIAMTMVTIECSDCQAAGASVMYFSTGTSVALSDGMFYGGAARFIRNDIVDE